MFHKDAYIFNILLVILLKKYIYHKWILAMFSFLFDILLVFSPFQLFLFGNHYYQRGRQHQNVSLRNCQLLNRFDVWSYPLEKSFVGGRNEKPKNICTDKTTCLKLLANKLTNNLHFITDSSLQQQTQTCKREWLSSIG